MSGLHESVAKSGAHAVAVAALIVTTGAGVLAERGIDRANRAGKRAGRILHVDMHDGHPLFKGYTSDDEPEPVQALPPNVVAEIHNYTLLARASYKNDNLAEAHPGLVKKSRLICNVKEQPRLMGGLASTDTQVHVCVRHDDTVLYVFRGTELESFTKDVHNYKSFIKDCLTDAYLLPESVKLYDAGPEPVYNSEASGSKMKAHKGFQLALKAVTSTTKRKDNLRMVLEDMGMRPQHVKKVVCLGHSLGGGLATLCATWCSVVFKDAEITCITEGSPRVGNAAFAHDFNTHVAKNSYRIVNKGDCIPCIPHHLSGYKHVRGGMYLAKDRTNKDSITCTSGGFRSNIGSIGINLWDHSPKRYESNFKKFVLQHNKHED